MVLETGLGAIDLQGRGVELSGKLREFVEERVDDEFGLAIQDITMNISLPDEIVQAINRGVARGQEEGRYAQNVGDVARLQQVRAADAMLAAASNEGGGLAGAGLQAGLGVALGAQMGQAFGQQGAGAGAAGPPPLPGRDRSSTSRSTGSPRGPSPSRSCSRPRPRARSTPARWCGPTA